MSDLKTVSTEIETWLRVHEIKRKALEAFFSYFDAYREEVPEEFESGCFPETLFLCQQNEGRM